MPRISGKVLASAALSAFAISFLAAPAISQDAAPAAQPAAAQPGTTPALAPSADWGTFGIQTQWIDRSVKPGDDFDAYVNGLWNKTAQLPPDRTRWGSFIELSDLSEQRVHAIMDQLVATPQAPGSDGARIAAAYKAFMDVDTINKAGLAPAKPYLARIKAAQNATDIVRLFGEPGYASPIGTSVGPDDKRSDIYALNASISGLGLPDRDYYLKTDPRSTALRDKYKAYLTFLLGQAGYPDAAARAQSVLDLETQIARADWDRAAARNPDLTYNKLTVAQFEALGKPGLLSTFLKTLGADKASYVLVTEMPPTPEKLQAARVDPAKASELFGPGMPGVVKLIETTPVATWQAYLTAHFLSGNASVLPSAIDDARFDFYGRTLSGQPQQRPRWKRGIGAVEGMAGELVGKLYAAKYFPPAQKQAMTELVANLRKAMAANLQDLSWMTPATRAEAEKKLDAFTPKIGAPDKFKTYDGLQFNPNDPLGNAIAANKWQIGFNMNRIGAPVDRTEWGMLPEEVNAYYNPPMNEIVFPAAILQPPFFNLSADPAVNYGGIGAVIGHEMGHGFDDQGAKYDGTGNLRDWWTPADKAAFDKLLDKLAAQYDAFCPFDDGKTCVNGKLTMGENIGDLGGLSLAYRAYKLSLNGKPAPVIDGFTGDQRFFMGWAQVWRSKVREAQARQYLIVDPHSPPQYRVNGIVRNFDEWYKAFDVKPGDKLYLAPKDRVRIW
ncbi:M13 family metallopeptidase [Novosphingobium sp. Leaf2]|uniref:M13 family metallopeptidase n=1 Tax=Novosphingobium sp. Leaf2 TaxID=1735670 RepID=UPI0006F82392|nr:M13-type metalloendopeptidase [Novosphingobium sp. Leaf2]KQM19528.1 zinc metalloprotease [Novosphingobium sp. Leaf2]